MNQPILGKAGNRNVTLDLVTLLTTRLLITANSGGGKSYLIRRLAEVLFGLVQVIIIDPEGEFSTRGRGARRRLQQFEQQGICQGYRTVD